MAANEVVVKALFAAEKPKVSMISSMISMTVNVALVIILAKYTDIGVGGIALISAVATIINLAINVAVSHKMNVCRFTLRDVLDFGVSIISAAAMIPAVKLIMAHFSGNLIVIVLSVAAAVPVYFIVSLILRSEEATFVVKGLLKKNK